MLRELRWPIGTVWNEGYLVVGEIEFTQLLGVLL